MIDINKEYCTVDGREVKLWTTDARDSNYPVKGEVNRNGQWYCESWMSDGLLLSDCTGGLDLVEVKPRVKQTYWINVYSQSRRGKTGYLHHTKKQADEGREEGAVACVEVNIDVEEGGGL